MVIGNSYLVVVKDGRREAQILSSLVRLALDCNRLTNLGSDHVLYLNANANTSAHLAVIDHLGEGCEVVNQRSNSAAVESSKQVCILWRNDILEDCRCAIVGVQLDLGLDVFETRKGGNVRCTQKIGQEDGHMSVHQLK